MRQSTDDRTPVVRAVDVARTFGSGASAVVAVNGVTCQLNAKESVALTGPSGSGKTTLLHLLAGLDIPTTGMIEWPAIGPREGLRPGPVAVVFQAPSLLPALDVIENAALPLLLAGVSRHAALAAASEALERLALDDLALKLPEELSGGQAQRVAVARVLAGRPQLILADEPTGQLDREHGAMVTAALADAARHSGAALVINTHDPWVAEGFDHQWTMTDGRLRVGEPVR